MSLPRPVKKAWGRRSDFAGCVDHELYTVGAPEDDQRYDYVVLRPASGSEDRPNRTRLVAGIGVNLPPEFQSKGRALTQISFNTRVSQYGDFVVVSLPEGMRQRARLVAVGGGEYVGPYPDPVTAEQLGGILAGIDAAPLARVQPVPELTGPFFEAMFPGVREQ